MKNRLFAFFLVLCLAASTAVYSQNFPASSSKACSNDLSASEEGCSQSQLNLSGNAFAVPIPESGEQNPSMGGTSAPSENAALGGRRVDLTPSRILPPDAPTEFQRFVAETTDLARVKRIP